jgi:hypothetical protein
MERQPLPPRAGLAHWDRGGDATIELLGAHFARETVAIVLFAVGLRFCVVDRDLTSAVKFYGRLLAAYPGMLGLPGEWKSLSLNQG